MQQGSPAEWSVFHFMCRILESTRGLCLPLPPGTTPRLTLKMISARTTFVYVTSMTDICKYELMRFGENRIYDKGLNVFAGFFCQYLEELKNPKLKAEKSLLLLSRKHFRGDGSQPDSVQLLQILTCSLEKSCNSE